MKKITIAQAEINHSKLIWEWRNDVETRLMSRTKNLLFCRNFRNFDIKSDICFDDDSQSINTFTEEFFSAIVITVQ